RAEAFELGDVSLGEARRVLHETIEDAGRHIDDDAVEEAAAATGGYPFMIQLVGYHIWRKADKEVIDMNAVTQGMPGARRRLGTLVHATTLADLSAVDRKFLTAMSLDDAESSISDVAHRLNVSSNYAGQYRLRLIDAGVIHSAGSGLVDFSIPYLREYLRNIEIRPA
ncbi:MAG: ATP-binding protein, partial [Propionibacteriaceae bacterium]|nr:ATP-binding protein [Propionibacteriaceae bacterium]